MERKEGKTILKYLFGNPDKGKKACIVKQHYINIGGFATQMEAYCLAEKICECLGVPEEHISINERYLEVSQAEFEKHPDKAQVAKSKHLPEETT